MNVDGGSRELQSVHSTALGAKPFRAFFLPLERSGRLVALTESSTEAAISSISYAPWISAAGRDQHVSKERLPSHY